MSASCSVYIATSLDGFIARSDGSIDWLNDANAKVPSGEDCGFAKFMCSVDALVMGRNTFDQILSFPDWPYGTTPVIVMSRTMHNLPHHLPPSVELSHEEPKSLVARLNSKGFKHLYIDGGKIIQSFLRSGLIQEITITTIPILLGSGRSLFGPLPCDVPLKHISTKSFEFGFVQSVYQVVQPA